MSAAPFFSVLVPVYNVEPWLPACIDSVLGQSFPDFELLLVDDGSTDRSGAICDEYAARDGRIRVFHKENGGLMSARRYTVERARGAYCLFLDSDDWLNEGALTRLSEAIRETGASCLIYGICWDRPGGVEHLSPPASLCGRLLTDRREVLNIVLNDDSYNSLCRKCASRACFDGRDFTPYFHIHRGEDRLQSTEILENAASFLFLSDELYHYRVNAESITHTIRYDSYRANYEVDAYIDQWLDRLDVLDVGDRKRLWGHLQDNTVLMAKRICRFCSSRERAVAALQTIVAEPFYRARLCGPYLGATRGVRGLLNRIALFLLRRQRYHALIFFCNRIYRAG